MLNQAIKRFVTFNLKISVAQKEEKMFLAAFALIFGVTTIVCAVIEIKKWRVNRTKLMGFSKLKEYPILGIGGRFIGQNNEEVMRSIDRLFYETKSNPWAAWFGPRLVIGIDDPEDMQTVLNAEQCLAKPYMYRHLRNITGLLASDNDVWKQHRRALNPTFSTKVISSFIPTFNKKAKILSDQMARKIGQPFDIYQPVFKALTDTILNTALGMEDWQLQTKRGDALHDMFIETMNLFQRRVVRFWLQWDFIYGLTNECKRESFLLDQAYRFLRSVREVKELKLSDKLEQGVDELEIAKAAGTLTWIQKCFLMYREGSFSEQNLIEEIDTAFVGGTDTTTVTISGTLIMLAMHPEYQEKVVAELHEIFDSADSPVTYEDLSKMTYMEMVIKEALRHFPGW